MASQEAYLLAVGLVVLAGFIVAWLLMQRSGIRRADNKPDLTRSDRHRSAPADRNEGQDRQG